MSDLDAKVRKAAVVIGWIVLGAVIIFVGVVIYFMIGMRNTTWGGWEPPDTDLILTKSEVKWKNWVQKKYDCSFEFIGLERAFMNDNVIYIDLKLKDSSSLQSTLCDSLEWITRKLSISFLSASENKRKQNQIEFSFGHHLYETRDSLRKWPTVRKCVYEIPTRTTFQIYE